MDNLVSWNLNPPDIFTAAARWAEVVIMSKNCIFVCVYVLDTFIKSRYTNGQDNQGSFQNGQEDKKRYQEDKDGH